MFNIMFSSCIKNPKNVYFDGEDKDEYIMYVFRRSFITNLDWIFVSVLLFFTPFIVSLIFNNLSTDLDFKPEPMFIFSTLLFWYLFTIGYIFINFINWFYNIYVISNKRMLDLDFVGFLYKNISEAPLSNIEDVTSNISGALRMIFNYGSVFIQTAAEKSEFEFTDIHNPAYVRDIISDIISEREKK